MDIGIPREIKPGEGRVALLPPQVGVLVAAGHRVWVEAGAGALSGASDDAYREAGAEIVADGAAVYGRSTLVVKVKEVIESEFGHLRPDHVILSNLHSALNRPQLDRMLEVGLTAIAAEETHQFGSPNSALAGEVGALEGVRLSLAPHGGSGRHFMAHFGAPPATALVVGLGNVGRGCLRTLLGLGLSVVGFDSYAGVRKALELEWYKADFRAQPVEALADRLGDADMVFNCVLWDKSRGDHLITRAMLGIMKPTAVIVDISCDTAGAVETSRPTTWDDPVYVVDGIRHFCVDNIPGAVPATASAGYAEAVAPGVRLIADHGPLEACRRDPWLARGLTCVAGVLTLEEAATVQNRPFTPAAEVLAAGP